MSNYEAAGAVLAGLMVFFGIFMIIGLAISVFMIIATWKILEKGNKPGWGALIPFYNTYLLCDMTGVNPWWILITALSPMLSFIPIIGSLASLAASIYFSILLYVGLARSFKKEDAYAIGLILLPIIFLPILAFGKENKYVGKNPMKDIIFDNINQNNSDEK